MRLLGPNVPPSLVLLLGERGNDLQFLVVVLPSSSSRPLGIRTPLPPRTHVQSVYNAGWPGELTELSQPMGKYSTPFMSVKLDAENILV